MKIGGDYRQRPKHPDNFWKIKKFLPDTTLKPEKEEMSGNTCTL
jgi:hypothetical protein